MRQLKRRDKHHERNSLLSEMTEEVAQLVLRNNYMQTQALALAVDQPRILYTIMLGQSDSSKRTMG